MTEAAFKLSDRGRLRSPLVDRAVALAAAHGVTVEYAAEPRSAHAFACARRVHVAPIAGDREFAIFLHELAHVVLGHDDERADRPAEERAAWRWAMRTAGRRWTEAMHDELAWSVRSYRGQCRTMDDQTSAWALVVDSETQARERNVVRIGR